MTERETPLLTLARGIATLTALRDVVDAAIKAKRAEHTERCLEIYREKGTPTWHVKATAEGPNAAIYTVPVPKPVISVTDRAALLAWAKTERRELVETVHVAAVAEHDEERLAGKALTAYLDGLKMLPSGAMLDMETGEIVPGAEHKSAPPKSVSLRFPGDGREEFVSAWRDGLLDLEVRGADLPQIGRAS